MGIEKGLREHQFTEEELSILLEDPTIDEYVNFLQKLKVGEFYKRMYDARTNTKHMLEYIEMLRKAGLNIDKGDAEFGYKMPLPKKYEGTRQLIIFRKDSNLYK